MILEESFSLALLPRDCKIGKIVPICKRDQRLYFKLLHFVYSLSSKLLKHILPPSIASHLMLTVSFFDYQHELHKEFSCHLQLNLHMKFTSPWTKVITPMPPSSSCALYHCFLGKLSISIDLLVNDFLSSGNQFTASSNLSLSTCNVSSAVAQEANLSFFFSYFLLFLTSSYVVFSSQFVALHRHQHLVYLQVFIRIWHSRLVAADCVLYCAISNPCYQA